MTPDPQAMAPYRRIAAQIIQRIERGELRPGDRIPSVREIESSEGISRATATRVAAVLRAEGYAESVPGIGTIVVERRKITLGADRLQMLRAGGDGFRDGERVEIVDAELVAAPDDVADALGLSENSSVIRRRRRYLDDVGVVTLSTSWLPPEFVEAAPELVSTEPLPKMTFGLVEERTGRRAVRRRDTVSVAPVPEDIAPLLECEPGATVIIMTNHYWDREGKVTEYAVDYHGAGRSLSAEYDLD